MRRLAAITACTTGLAHTYLAAESLSIAAKALQVEIKIETRGAIGVENRLTDLDLEKAEAIIIVTDINIDLKPYANKRLIIGQTRDAISQPEALIKRGLGGE